MGLGGGSLLCGNPQPVLPLVFHIVQEVESVRWREPARGNKQKNTKQTTDCNSAQHQNAQPAVNQNMQPQNDMRCQVKWILTLHLPSVESVETGREQTVSPTMM